MNSSTLKSPLRRPVLVARTLVAGLALCLLAGVAGCGDEGDGPPTSIQKPLKHRESAAACNADDARSDAAAGPTVSDCQTDADCTGMNARCLPLDDTGGKCTSDQCQTDADCGDSRACLCDAGGNRCLQQGDCLTNADCGEGGYCSPSLGSCGSYGGVVAYFCHTASDECTDDADCAGEGGGYCAFNQDVGRWRCSTDECVG